MVVDLPEPDGPITATKSPRAMSRSMPFSAWNAVAPWPNVLVTPRRAMIGPGASIGVIGGAARRVATPSRSAAPGPAAR